MDCHRSSRFTASDAEKAAARVRRARLLRRLVPAPALCLLASACMFGLQEPGGPTAGQDEQPPSGIVAQYRLEPRHQGLSPPGTSLGPALEQGWKSDALGIGDYTASKSSPAVDGERVYIGVDDGRLYALDRDDGSVLWAFETERYPVEKEQSDSKHHGIHGSPAFDQSKVYIGDYSGYLYAVDGERGEMVWKTKLGGSIGASPVLYDGYVFIAVEFPAPDGKIFVLDAETGSVVFATANLGDHPHSSVSLDPERGYMFVGANNGRFFCFDFVRRRQVWRYQTGAEIKSTAAVVGDTVYITSWDQKLHALDIESGDKVFEFTAAGASMSSPSYHQGRIYFGADDGRLYCIDADEGTLLWSHRTAGIVASSPTVVQETGVVVVGSRDQYLYLLDAENGEPLWSAQLDGMVSSVPVAVDSALFVNDDTGTIFCYLN